MTNLRTSTFKYLYPQKVNSHTMINTSYDVLLREIISNFVYLEQIQINLNFQPVNIFVKSKTLFTRNHAGYLNIGNTVSFLANVYNGKKNQYGKQVGVIFYFF